MNRGVQFLSLSLFVCSCSHSLIVDGHASASSRSLRFQEKWGSPLPLYLSDDENEERILEALEKIDCDVTQTQTSGDYTLTNDYDDDNDDDDDEDHAGSEKKRSTTKDLDQHHSQDQRPSRSKVQYVSIPSEFQVNASTSPQTEVKKTATAGAPRTPTSTTSSWVRHFLAQCHRDVLLPVPTDFLLDNFNLADLAPVVEAVGLQAQQQSIDDGTDIDGSSSSSSSCSSNKQSFPIYRQALRLLVDQTEHDASGIPGYLDRAAQALYLLVHQRYVLSTRGLDMVRRRFLLKAPYVSVDPIFGKCPRISCRGTPLLPFGDSENYSIHNNDNHKDDEEDYYSTRAKRYCCSCRQLWYHWDSRVDGCAWGPSFCHLFLMTCGHEVFGGHFLFTERQGTTSMLLPDHQPKETTHVPRIFGFRLHPQSSTSWYQ